MASGVSSSARSHSFRSYRRFDAIVHTVSLSDLMRLLKKQPGPEVLYLMISSHAKDMIGLASDPLLNTPLQYLMIDSFEISAQLSERYR